MCLGGEGTVYLCLDSLDLLIYSSSLNQNYGPKGRYYLSPVFDIYSATNGLNTQKKSLKEPIQKPHSPIWTLRHTVYTHEPICIWSIGPWHRKRPKEIMIFKIYVYIHDLLHIYNLLHISPGVVVVYHVTIVAFGHGLLKKFWPFW